MESAYSRQKEAFDMKNIAANEIYVYHKSEISREDKIEIIHNNLEVENCSGFTVGRGIYFSEYPDLHLGYSDSGLLLCKVMPGHEYLDKSYRLIPDNYNSKRVLASEGCEEMLIVENSSQILPCYYIHLDKTSVPACFPNNLAYSYKVKNPTDNRAGPLEDETKIPRLLTVYARNVPNSTNTPDPEDEEQEPICGSTSGNVPNIRAPVTPISQILNNGK